MRQTFYFGLMFIFGILLFGCTGSGGNGGNNNANTTNNTVTNVTVDGFSFSLPSELPIAYVGTPYFYSFCNPEPTGEPSGFFGYACGEETAVNPSGGESPYYIETTVTGGYNAYRIKVSGGAFLNFTPEIGDEGEYSIEVCASDSEYKEICGNTTLYVMSDIVTIKGDGAMSYSLMLKLNSNVKASDFRGTEVEKNATTGYTPTTNFIFNKVTAEVQPTPRPCEPGVHCGGGAYASLDVKADSSGIELIAEGSAPCGEALGSEFPGQYSVDYFHVGYVGYTDNAYVALEISNTGTEAKQVDITLVTSSELGSESKNYYSANANAELCIDDECIISPTGAVGSQMANSTTVRAVIRPGTHWIVVGRMNAKFANTNTVKCPSVVKAGSKVVVTINEVDGSDGKKPAGYLYSFKNLDGTKESVWKSR